MNPVVIAAAALGASVGHVFTGPDHLAAVLPMAVARRDRAAAVGAWWGFGHGSGVVAIGVLSRLLIGPARLASISNICEIVVGGLLVVLGGRAIHASGWGKKPLASHADHHHHRRGPFGFGALHGAAGGGHVFGVLPSLALSPSGAAIYLSVYLLGAVGAMSVFALVCGRAVPERRVPQILCGAGVVATTVGLVWIGAALVAA